VVGISKNDFSTDIIFELALMNRLYGACGTHGHKNRRLNFAMVCGDYSCPRAGFGICCC
jgi:hypothetical protein